MTETITMPHVTDWRTTGCPVCRSTSLDAFFTLSDVPAQDGVLWNTVDEALAAPRGDIQLMLCNACGYIGNHRHDPSKVRFTGYDVSLQHSPLFREFTDTLARRLMERHDLRGKTILDIGCGKGFFLSTLCRLGNNRGIGFDPSYAPGPESEADGSTTFINDYYSPAYARYEADLISCRHVIDILGDPAAFLEMVRANIGSRKPVVYFESPDASYTLGNAILWNIVYEHKSWFTLGSYRRLFERSGFDVLNVSRCWNDEYIGIEAVPSERQPGVPPPGHQDDRALIEETALLCSAFAAGYAATVERWGERLRRLEAAGTTVALWGSGARGIAFLNFFRHQSIIRTVIDINPKRQGKFLPISALRVESPECLAQTRPDIVIISNPTYEHEIRRQAAQLGYQGEFLVL